MKNLLRRITHSLSYTFTILIRKAVKSIAVVLSIAAFTVLLCLLEFTVHKQEQIAFFTIYSKSEELLFNMF